MDLNTGTPIQNPSSQLPPLSQQSVGLPVQLPMGQNDVSQQIPDTTDPVMAMPPLSSNPMVSSTNSSAEEKKPSFLDPLEMLKKMTGNAMPEVPVDQPPVAVHTDMPKISDAVSMQPVTGEENKEPLLETKMINLPNIAAPLQETPVTDKPFVPMPSAEMKYAAIGNIQMDGPYDIQRLLTLVIEKSASDLHIVVGYCPMIRIDGDLVTVGTTLVTPQLAKELIYTILPDDKKEQLEVNREVDLAYQHQTGGRFRINAYWQRGYLSATFRLIPARIRTINELKLPDMFHKFVDMEQGLVLFTGPTGHGKSTSLAAVIQEINMKYPKHILTIEDPIEYVFPQQKSLVSQRELGEDTHSWKGALRSALREDPDVVLVGEMRDLETISAALTVAETGHLVFATLHTNNAAQTIQRIVNMYPDVQQDEVRTELADVLEAVVAQRLIPIKGGGRRAALEIMLMTPAVRNLIRENKIYQIDNVIRTSLDIGMITLERSLLDLFKEGAIDEDMALRYALDSNEMTRLIEELI